MPWVNPLEAQTFNLLVQFYLDPAGYIKHNGRWDVWLILHSKWDERMLLLCKSDSELLSLTDNARKRAEVLRKSRLYQALKEES